MHTMRKYKKFLSALLFAMLLLSIITTPISVLAENSMDSLCSHQRNTTDCPICPLQERINALPGAEELETMEEQEQKAVQEEMTAIYKELDLMDESISSQLDRTQLEVVFAFFTSVQADDRAEDEDPATAKISTEEKDREPVKEKAEDPPADESLYDDYRIQTVSPENVSFNLFDYWVRGEDVHDHPYRGDCTIDGCNGDNYFTETNDTTRKEYYSQGINKDHAFIFKGAGNVGLWNRWTGKDGGARLGIVQNTLTNGYPTLNPAVVNVTDPNVTVLSDGAKDPAKAEESLAYLFSPDFESEGKKSYTDVKGLLKIDEQTGNYRYSSLENFASLAPSGDSFNIYNREGIISNEAQSSVAGQFFPFNKASQVFHIETDPDTGELGLINKINGSDLGNVSFLNHYFGLTMGIDFQQPHNGKVSNAAKSQDMIFQFTGDDDVWIFIDNVLVADLGGIHDTMTAKINFQNGQIITDREDHFEKMEADHISPEEHAKSCSLMQIHTLKESFENAGNYDSTLFKDNTFANGTTHELKMFYLERGNFASNLELEFNLTEPRFGNIDKVDQDGNALGDVTFGLYEADKDWSPNGDPIAELTTEDDGFVDLATTINGKLQPITFKPGQNYVLREVETRPGYITTGDIHLTYDAQTNTLKVDPTNQWETGAQSAFEAQVYQTSRPKYDEDQKDATEDAKKGLIIGVPMFNSKGGGMKPEGWNALYGSITTGFHHVMPTGDVPDRMAYQKMALEAAMRQLENPKHEHWHLDYNNEFMRFEGVLEDLPGTADRYVFVNEATGDMLTAYYLFLPDDDLFDGKTTAEEKHNALMAKMNRMSEDEKTQFFKDNTDNMRLLDISQFNRQFYTRLYIPNKARTLRVLKQDEQGDPLPNAEFTLYKDPTCTEAVAKGITNARGVLTFSVQNTGNNAVNGGELSSEVQFILGRELAADGTKHNRSYWLKETAPPSGYLVNESISEVCITNDSLYVNAGDDDNGVSVRKGAGVLVQTMISYATDDGLNITLRDVLASKYAYDKDVSGDKLPPFKEWSPASNEEALSLHYGLDNKLLDYGLHDTSRKPYFETDTGWIGIGLKQNYNAHLNNGDEWSQSGGVKEDISNLDISALFTGTTTVVVTDKPEPTTPPDPEDPKNPPKDPSNEPPTEETPLANAPQTGDENNPLIWLILFGVSGASLLISLILLRRRNSKK